MDIPKMNEKGHPMYNKPSFMERVKSLQQGEWKDMYEKEFDRMTSIEGGFHNKIKRQIPYRVKCLYDKVKPGKVLEVGCGDGYILYRLQEELDGLDCHGIDVSENAIAVAKENVEGKFEVMNAEEQLPEGKYDTVICLEVLEHLKEPEELAKKMFDLLVPGGRLLISVPIEKHIDWYTHIQEFDFIKLNKLFREIGDNHYIYRIHKFYEDEVPNMFFVEVHKK